MNPFLYNAVPQFVPLLFQGSNTTSQEISILETPRILNYGQFFHNFPQSHAHMNPFLYGIINSYLQPTRNGSSLPIVHFPCPYQEKE
jgi:hypothetical protein